MENTIESKTENNLLKASIWYNRVIMGLVTALFIMIGLRNGIHPAESAKAAGITLETANGMSVGRVSMGAFPLGFAIIIFTCLLSVDYILFGIRSVFIMLLVVTVMRVIGYTIDGAAPFIVPEVVVTILSGIGYYMEMRRRKLISM